MSIIKQTALIAGLIAPAAHALSVNEYNRLEPAQEQSYMAGVADALAAIHNSERGSALACVPGSLRFDGNEVSQRYREYLKTYPQVREHLTDNVSVADVVLGAYSERYCGRPGSGGGTEEQTPYPLSPLP